MLQRIFRRFEQPVFETLQAASSPLPLSFDGPASVSCCLRPHPLQPVGMVIIRIHNVQSEGRSITRTFILTYEIFLKRVNVRIAIIYGRTYAAAHQTFDNGRGTGCATGVQKNSLRATRSRDCQRFLNFHYLSNSSTRAVCAATIVLSSGITVSPVITFLPLCRPLVISA